MPIKHLVVFEFKSGTTEAQIHAIMRSLADLVGKVPGLIDFAGGPYSGPYPGAEGLNKAYSHGFVMTFQDTESRAGYLPHPDHIRVRDELIPHVRDLVAFDFEV